MKRDSAADLMAVLMSQSVTPNVLPGFYTTQELANASGLSIHTVRRRIKALGAEERMFRVRLGSKLMPVPHYKLKLK